MLRSTLALFCISLLVAHVASAQSQSQKTSSKLPAIDEAAPKKFETATLALG